MYKHLHKLVFLAVFCTLYFGSSHILKSDFDYLFPLILAVPVIAFFYKYSDSEPDACEQAILLPPKTACFVVAYSIAYYIMIFKINILGASVCYWLVQFLFPCLILRYFGCSLAQVGFSFGNIFKDFGIVALSCIWLTPFLLYGVRDSDKILPMVTQLSFYIYLPASILMMVVIVAFWEEFFFRGAIQSSILSLFNMRFEYPVLITSIFFGIYHFPFRYLNEKSEHYNDILGSIASCLNEQFIMGVFLGLVVYKSKNVWHGIWLHAFMNGISNVYRMSQMIKFG